MEPQSVFAGAPEQQPSSSHRRSTELGFRAQGGTRGRSGVHDAMGQGGEEGVGVRPRAAETASTRAVKASPRLILGRSATIAAIAATQLAAGARVSSLGRRVGEEKEEEELESCVGGLRETELGLPMAWHGLVAGGGALT